MVNARREHCVNYEMEDVLYEDEDIGTFISDLCMDAGNGCGLYPVW